MALRKYHILGAIFLFLAYLVAYFALFEKHPKFVPFEPIWVTTAFLMAIVGSEFPDWDHMIHFLSHRDITTHSAGIAVLLFLVYTTNVFFFENLNQTLVYGLALAAFMIGLGSHLLLDLFPTYDPEKLINDKGALQASAYMLGGVIQGLTGQELVKALKGTYLIHLPFKSPVMKEGKKVGRWEMRRTLPLHQTRWWLFINGIISLLLGGTVVWMYFAF